MILYKVAKFSNFNRRRALIKSTSKFNSMARFTYFHLLNFHIFCLLCILFMTVAERVMRPKIKDIKVWSDNDYATHSIAFDEADPHFNFSMTALKELHDVDIHIEAQIVQKLDPTYFFSFNTTMNLCRILHWRNKSPIGALIYAYLREYGKLLETCPIAKGQYFIHKFWIPEDTTTALLPEANFNIHFSAHHVDANKKKTLIADDYITGEAVVIDANNVKQGVLGLLSHSG